MSVGDNSVKKENLKSKYMKKGSSPGKLATMKYEVERLQRQLTALLQKIDADSGDTGGDNDYESVVDAVK